MTEPFPPQRFLRGNFAPLRTECDAPDLVVHGDLPRALHGTLLRNGPNPFYPPRDAYHMFSGDGMVHAFHFAEGRVSYRNRWVMTDKLKRERAAGRALFGTFGNPATSDPSVHGLPYNVANTHVLWHGGRLLALEEFNLPFELDPHTLAARGPCDFDGRLRGPMTAHPKICPRSGEMHFFGHGVDGFGSRTLAYHVADADGQLVHSVRFEAPYAALVHDFILTEHWVLFPIFPLTISPARARAGGPLLGWEPDRPSAIGRLPRRGSPADMHWYEGEACCVFHPLNAYEAGDEIVADMLRYDAGPGFPLADGRPPDPAQAVARLERWRFPLGTARSDYTITRLDDDAAEYPRCDERYTGLPYRHGWFATTPGEQGRAAVFDRLAHYDFDSHTKRCWTLPPGDFTSEPVFVPRSVDAPEGDGWLLAVVYRGREARSDLVVLNALDVEAGPIASAALEVRVPFGFHGSWMPA